MKVNHQFPSSEKVQNGRRIQREMRSNHVRWFACNQRFEMAASAAQALKHACTLRRERINLPLREEIHIGRSGDNAGNFNSIFRQMANQISKDAARSTRTLGGPRNSDLHRPYAFRCALNLHYLALLQSLQSSE